MTGEMNPEALVQGLKRRLQSQWEQKREQAFNPNTKGASYEEALRDFLSEYFGGIYNFYTRTAVIDDDLEVFDLFSAGECEFDVVSTFRQAYPSFILKVDDMKWVPYPAVSFICEVKSRITKSSLESDLEKISKLNQLGPDNYSRRFPNRGLRVRMFTGEGEKKGDIQQTQVNHQLKCLVYDENSISGETLLNIATENTDIWDLILLVEDDLILVSSKLPFVEGWYKRLDDNELDYNISEELPNVLVLPDGLVWFIVFLSISIPDPTPLYSGQGLLQLVQREWKEEPTEYDTAIGAWDQLMD